MSGTILFSIVFCCEIILHMAIDDTTLQKFLLESNLVTKTDIGVAVKKAKDS